MTETARLKLPLLAAAQAQKHVTHNEALTSLDTLTQASVIDKDLATPPGSPTEGDCYIVAGTASGAWSGWEARIARSIDGSWRSYIPGAGWRVYVQDEAVDYVFDGADWVMSAASGTYLPLAGGIVTGNLGVGGATPDATNRLAVASPAILFNRETDDIQVKLNKQGAADDAAFTFQTGFSTRGLIGLLGDDDFTFKVSPDGSAFHTSFVIDRTSGNAAFNGAPTAPTAAPGTNSTQLATTAFVTAAVAALIASAPGALDTLDELAAALGDDANFAATVTTSLAGKQPLDATLTAFAGLTITQGSLVYGTGSDAFALLAKDTNSTRYLSNTGSSNNPAWAQVNLANGVTGDLPFSNIAQIATDRLAGRDTASTGDIEEIALGTGLEFTGSQSIRVTPNARTGIVGITIDGGGSAITTGVKGYIRVPFACTITKNTVLADQSGSIVIDIWKDSYANYPPTVADTITASAKPTLSAAAKSEDGTLTGWTTSISAGDTLGFKVDSASTVTRVHLILDVVKSA